MRARYFPPPTRHYPSAPAPAALIHALTLKALGLTDLDLKVLLVLLIRARDRGATDVSQGTIARILDVTRIAVNASIGRLERAGLIRRDKVDKASGNPTGRRVVLLFWDDPAVLPKTPDTMFTGAES